MEEPANEEVRKGKGSKFLSLAKGVSSDLKRYSIAVVLNRKGFAFFSYHSENKEHYRGGIQTGYGAVSLFYNRWKETPNGSAFRLIKEDGSIEVWTWDKIEKVSNSVANWALKQNLQSRDVVGLMMDNSPEYLSIWLGLAKVGVVASLINTHAVRTPLAHAIEVCKSKMNIISGNYVSKIEEALRNATNFWVWNQSGDRYEGFENLDWTKYSSDKPTRETWKELKATDALFYIYTSGTTGLPKASIVNHMKFVSAGFTFGGLLKFTDKEVLYSPLPLYHSAAGLIALSLCINRGYPFVTRRKFSVTHFWQDCIDNSVTIIQYLGETCRYLLAAPPSDAEKKHQIRVAFGNGLRTDIWEKFKSRFNIPYIGEFYGSTEGNASLVNPYNRTGAVGYVSPLMKKIYPVKIFKFDLDKEELIRGSNGLCVECKAGEKGELMGIIGNSSLREFPGYTDKLETQKKVACDVSKKGDKWFRTGDILYQDKEGFLYFVDRIGDTYRWKGENVATNEVSEILCKVGEIQEANVYGVSVPGHDGRAGMVSIVARPGLTLNLKEFYETVVKELPLYAAPYFVRIQGEMEITSTFKHRKVGLMKDGFNPDVVKDPLYFRDDRNKRFVILDENLYKEILTGNIRM